MTTQRVTHGWAGTFREFLDTPPSLIEASLERHIADLFGMGGASSLQSSAWEEEIELLRNSLRDLSIARPDSLQWSLILEYELPLEGGRRPDAIILGPQELYVLEFKQDPDLQRAYIDQVNAYARDLSEYHSKTHGLKVTPLLIPTKVEDFQAEKDGVLVLSKNRIAPQLDLMPQGIPVDLGDWLAGDYAPLPTLIAAAKMIFNNERLPAIKRTQSLGVGEAVSALRSVVKRSKDGNERSLAFVSGVPGAGKTLVGLQFVYAESDTESQAIFLSGNGPLVEVLRDALKSKAFVSDLHAFIKSYGMTSKVPKQHIVVFDEAQRAWDQEHMNNKKAVPHSEPELLISIGEKISDWATLVGLIGHGQEINTGEEAGIEGWFKAVKSQHAKSQWKIYAPPRFAGEFPGEDIEIIPSLDLTKTLRSRQAEDLHDWVQNLLEGNLSTASKIASKIWLQNYPIFVTRNLDEARSYLWSMYSEQPSKRYGILASSKDKHLPSLGIRNGFQDTKLVKYANWYNNEINQKGSCCNLDDVVTEFGCQGLELDMAIVAWGNDFLWDGSQWVMRKMRSRFPQRDPHQLRLNSYRVLLTRSRDGMVVFVPEGAEFDKSEHALLASGARVLEPKVSLNEAI